MFQAPAWNPPGPKKKTWPAILRRSFDARGRGNPRNYELELHRRKHAALAVALGLERKDDRLFLCTSPRHVALLAAFAHEATDARVAEDFPDLLALFRANRANEIIPCAPALDWSPSAGAFVFLAGAAYTPHLIDAGWWQDPTTSFYMTEEPWRAAAYARQATPAALQRLEQCGLGDRHLRAYIRQPVHGPFMAPTPDMQHLMIFAGQEDLSRALVARGLTYDPVINAYLATTVGQARPFVALLHPQYKTIGAKLTAGDALIDTDDTTIRDLIAIAESEDTRTGGSAKKEAPPVQMSYHAERAVWRTTDAEAALAAGFSHTAQGLFETADLDIALKLRAVADMASELAIEVALAKRYADEIATRAPLPLPTAPAGEAYSEEQAEALGFLSVRPHVLIADDMGLGKAQPIDEPVLTPAGWRPIGDIQINDYVIGRDGRPTRVTGVFPQGTRPVFRVTMNDRTQTRCCDEHLWAVNTPLRRSRGYAGRVLPLSEIRTCLRDGQGNLQHFIPVAAPVKLPEQRLPIDPWLLGTLLGDGGLRHGVKFSTSDQQIVDQVADRLPDSCRVTRDSGYDYRIRGRSRGKNILLDQIRELGLFGHYSYDKFIPSDYLFGSLEQRKALLQGLMDTDGTITSEGTVSFATSSPELHSGIAHLVRSLGGIARQTQKPSASGRPCYQTILCLPPEIVPFTLERKLARYRPRTKYNPAHAIADVTPDGDAECVCIRVEAADHLYLTRDCIVTHNTVVGAGAIEMLQPEYTLIVCMPQSIEAWVRHIEKWALHRPAIHIADANSPVRPGVTIVSDAILARAARLKAHRWGLGIFDEVHRFKSDDSARAAALYDPAEGIEAERTIDLTGTPIPNRPQDLFNLLHHKLPEIFHSRDTFKKLYGVEDLEKSVVDLAAARRRRTLGAILRQTIMIRRLKNMPVTKTRKTIAFEIDNPALVANLAAEHATLKAYETAKRTVDKTRILAELNRLRCETSLHKVPFVAQLVKDLIAEGNTPLIFGHHHVVIDALSEELDRQGFDLAKIHGGSTSAKQRQKIVDQFQAGNHHGLIAGIKSGGTSLTITRANCVVFIEIDWTPYDLVQAEDRAYRRGQMNDVLVIYVVIKNSVDSHVATVNNLKIRIASEILDPLPDELSAAIAA